MANLLVVDDDRSVSETLKTVLQLMGHTVRCVSDGEDGLAALRQEYPDLILLDVDMPRLNGPGMAYQMLVEDSGKEDIPILLISGVENLAAIAERIGTPYFIGKPFCLDEFERLTERALKEGRAPTPSPQLVVAAGVQRRKG